MRLKKFIKKAFTLVELVVVIAVVAILASVSVGLYFGITTTANKSVDEQVVTQYNKILELYEIQGKVGTEPSHVRQFIRENGIVNFTPFYQKNDYYWIGGEVNRVIIWEEGEGVTYPAKFANDEEYASLTRAKTTVENWHRLDEVCQHTDATKHYCIDTCGIQEGETCTKRNHNNNDYYKCNLCNTESNLPYARVIKLTEEDEWGSDLVKNKDKPRIYNQSVCVGGASYNDNLYNLDCKYVFSTAIDEEYDSNNEFNDWSVDYFVTFAKEGVTKDQQVGEADTFGVWGSFLSMTKIIPAPPGLTPGTDPIPLVRGAFGIPMNYGAVVSWVPDFFCGTWSNGENKGLVITVRLCMWQETEDAEFTYEQPHVVGEWSHTFTDQDNTTF